MIQKKCLLSCFLGAILITGCATLSKSECDPAIRHNTVKNLRCQFVYDEINDDLKKKYKEEQAINESLLLVKSLLEEERNSSSRSRSNFQSSYNKLNKTVSNLIEQVKSRESGNKNLATNVSKLQSKLDSVNKNPASSSDAKKQLALNSLRAEIESMQKELQY